ncbi:MAG TPA: APC family permease [Pirellulaceae bacterium]|nr:APC family permease [Pirellulaceae bacterium]HMP71071.1 APC family permease [Pirellulaceae bacterium]
MTNAQSAADQPENGRKVAETGELHELKRVVGLWGAVMMGLGSILGTGVFVSLAIATGVAGPAVVWAIAAAALVAICNGLSSAQLAAAYPVSGGTYEYGYRLLNPSLGFTAGWMFLCAKSASAATAALGFAGALGQVLSITEPWTRTLMAEVMVLVLTILIVGGIRRSNYTNMCIVIVTIVALLVFVFSGLTTAWHQRAASFVPLFQPVDEDILPWTGFLQSIALMFVAFTGYGRIATLAEEVRQPRRTIPIAVIVTLLISMALYIMVGFVAIGAVGATDFAGAGIGDVAPLQVISDKLGLHVVSVVVAVGAITAMLGVSLNLILGLSRVALAMARRRDVPGYFARVRAKSGSPDRAIWLVAILIFGLILIGDVKVTWSFSAFTVLIYYAITNLAAIRLPKHQRLYPVVIAWLGLASCLGLAFWVEPSVWLLGLCLIAVGLVWHAIAQRLRTT